MLAFANGCELTCEPKQLILLYYKICPCFPHHFTARAHFVFKGNLKQKFSLMLMNSMIKNVVYNFVMP